MCSDNVINRLRGLASREYERPLSKVDTQVFFVEPVVRLLNYGYESYMK